jgi:hypothetical protein
MLLHPAEPLVTPMEMKPGQHMHGGSDPALMRTQLGGQLGRYATALEELRDEVLGQDVVVRFLCREVNKRPPDPAALTEVHRMVTQPLHVMVGVLDQAFERR